jgi:putative restriction endonuclease
MLYLEMSREESPGGGLWAFPRCVWVPTKKTDGTSWPFWAKILDIRTDYIILHLRGRQPNALFVGYSRAASDGQETYERPPDPGPWSYAKSFYKADLVDFTPFETPIRLSDIFAVRRNELEAYFDTNRKKGLDKRNLFYVRQSKRLQCLNGAYLSDIDEELFVALFDRPALVQPSGNVVAPVSVATGQQLVMVLARIGQSTFSKKLKELYGGECCFPSCSVNDNRFLVASHIDRWTDNKELRGHFGNGLCLCLMHDKAFEIGLFTVDQNLKIYVNPNAVSAHSSLLDELGKSQGKPIKLCSVAPLKEALAEHWRRTKINALLNR